MCLLSLSVSIDTVKTTTKIKDIPIHCQSLKLVLNSPEHVNISEMCLSTIKFIIKGIFRCKFNPWSNTPWHRVRPFLKSFPTTSLCSFSNLRKDHTITILLIILLDTYIKAGLTNDPQVALMTLILRAHTCPKQLCKDTPTQRLKACNSPPVSLNWRRFLDERWNVFKKLKQVQLPTIQQLEGQ